jgi:carboxylesterase type B
MFLLGQEFANCLSVVSYRLNIFGFPNSPVANKNAGLMDVRLVYGLRPNNTNDWFILTLCDSVEWLKDNIAGFG